MKPGEVILCGQYQLRKLQNLRARILRKKCADKTSREKGTNEMSRMKSMFESEIGELVRSEITDLKSAIEEVRSEINEKGPLPIATLKPLSKFLFGTEECL